MFQEVVKTSDQLKEDTRILYEKADVLLSSEMYPQDEKTALRRKLIIVDNRAYDLPQAAKDKYEEYVKGIIVLEVSIRSLLH